MKILLLCLFTCLNAFEILPQNDSTHNLGFGEWNIAIDGEAVLMKEFLKPNNTVLDIGANCGEWTQFALNTEPSIKVFAFEPVPPVFERLKLTLGKYSNVKLFNHAISDKIGIALFHYYPEADGLSGFFYREVLRGDHPDPLILEVPEKTLDAFCYENNISEIDFIKIDTEGAEWKVLTGAKSLIQNHKIKAIQFEYGGCYVDAKTTLKSVMTYLSENGYILFRIMPKGLIHISKWEDRLENYHLSNYFAIRQEDMPEYALIHFE